MSDDIKTTKQARELLTLAGLGPDERSIEAGGGHYGACRHRWYVPNEADHVEARILGEFIQLNPLEAAELGLWLLRFSIGLP